MPDGHRLLFMARSGDKPVRVYLQDVSGEPARPFGPEGYEIGAPVSPDGKTAILNKDGRWFFLPLEGGEPRPIPGVGPEVDDVLRWDRAGQSLYLRKGSPRTEIWRLDLASGRQEKLGAIEPSDRTGAEGIESVLLTPDGKTYAYSFQRRLSTLFVVTGLR